MSKRRTELFASVLLLGVLVPYFLFQTNLVYEAVGVQSYSLPLSKYRMSDTTLRFSFGYFDESEVYGAFWVSKNVDDRISNMYADYSSATTVLLGYGMTYNVEILSNVTVLSTNAIVYLNRANLAEGIFVGSDYTWNSTNISPIFSFTNKVYSNGGCEVYQNAFD